MTRVLVVEDDDSMARALRDGFQYEGYEVILARDGVAGLRFAAESRPDVIILDVMMPKMSGLDVCKQLRAAGSRVPILMLTARGQEIDKVLGLKLGADDYVTKPFGFLELVARVEALLRRAHAGGGDGGLDAYRFGDIEVDFKQHVIHKGGKPLDLSPRELRLLRYLIEHKGEVVGRDQLLDAVWDYDSPPLTRTVDMHVAKLRRKIEDQPAEPRWIVTVHRVGYKFMG
jgi:two-component system alkaline phosphatase synthesis response regulator PhoP